MLQEILFVLAGIYLLMMVAYALAAALTRYSTNRKARPAVSVIIAARNEEENIRTCLDSVVRLTYPTRSLEVIVVDDRSTDATQKIVRQFTHDHPHIRLVVAAPGSGQLRGKTNAVMQGIDASRGEILLFTDADCTVPGGWVEETVKYYVDPNVGIVAGFTSLRAQGWFSSMQALDWFVLFTVAAGAVGLQFPITAVGNNLSVRRKAYDEVGGYRVIPFSVTEDYALFHAVTTKTKYRPLFPIDRAALVESAACETWKELYRQKKRWFTGGRDFNPARLFLFALTYLFHILILLSLLFADGSIALSGFALKALVDFCLALPTARVFKRWKLLKYFPLFELYLTCYVIVLPLVVLFATNVIWKERTFEEEA